MPVRRTKHFLPTLVPIFAVLAIMVGLVAYSPTLYRLFCAATGYGGTVRRSVQPVAAREDEAASGKTITVFFDSNVANGLPWDFRPEQRSVTVPLGKPTKVYYDARNNSNRTIVARAVYNVTPGQIATYFFKIECFCFTNERLNPGESARMPLVFYIDKQAASDEGARHVSTVTLSYTFYPQDKLSPQEIANTRDLGTGSAGEDAKLVGSSKATFANDAPRR
jgi:cytochrome c oxidase assembly protein subunit 11